MREPESETSANQMEIIEAINVSPYLTMFSTLIYAPKKMQQHTGEYRLTFLICESQKKANQAIW